MVIWHNPTYLCVIASLPPKRIGYFAYLCEMIYLLCSFGGFAVLVISIMIYNYYNPKNSTNVIKVLEMCVAVIFCLILIWIGLLIIHTISGLLLDLLGLIGLPKKFVI